MRFNFMGNAPVGYHEVAKRQGIYFFKAQVSNVLNIDELLKQTDYIWVDKSELQTFIKSEKYLKEVNKFILDF